MTHLAFALAAAFGFAVSLSATASAGDSQERDGAHSQAPQPKRTYQLRGRVNSGNIAAVRLNITHEPVGDPQLPTEMRINFEAHDAALLQGIEPGTMMGFVIERMGDEYHLTKIERVD